MKTIRMQVRTKNSEETMDQADTDRSTQVMLQEEASGDPMGGIHSGPCSAVLRLTAEEGRAFALGDVVEVTITPIG